MAELYPLHISIPSALCMSPTLRRKYTSYVISVDDCGKVNLERRRYREFAALQAQLQKRGFRQVLPSFPVKKFIGRRNPEFVEERRTLLQTYLRSLLEVEEVVQDQLLWSFLRVSGITAFLVRLVSFPWVMNACMDRTVLQLESMAKKKEDLFRLCSAPVVRTILRLAREEVGKVSCVKLGGRDFSKAYETGSKAPAAALEAAVSNAAALARRLCGFCMIIQSMSSHRHGRSCLEAGNVMGLLFLLFRCLVAGGVAQVMQEAKATADRSDDGPLDDPFDTAVRCAHNMLLRTRGAAMLRFLESNGGVDDLVALTRSSEIELRRVAAELLWLGLEDEGVVVAFLGSTSNRLEMLCELLSSDDTCTALCAGLCVGILLRRRRKPTDATRPLDQCLNALVALPDALDVGSLRPGVERLHGLLNRLCGGNGLERLRPLLFPEGPNRAEADDSTDAVTGLAIAVLDHYVVLHSTESSMPAGVAEIVSEVLAKNLFTRERPSSTADFNFGADVRQARLMLLLGHAEGKTTEPLEVVARRAQALELLSRSASQQRQLLDKNLQAARDTCNGHRRAVEGFTVPLCVSSEHLNSFRRQLQALSNARKSLSEEAACAEGHRADGVKLLEVRRVQREAIPETARPIFRQAVEQTAVDEKVWNEACVAQRERVASEDAATALAKERSATKRESEALLHAAEERLSAHRSDLNEKKLAVRNREAALKEAPIELERVRAEYASCEKRREGFNKQAEELDKLVAKAERQLTELQADFKQAQEGGKFAVALLKRLRALQRSCHEEDVPENSPTSPTCHGPYLSAAKEAANAKRRSQLQEFGQQLQTQLPRRLVVSGDVYAAAEDSTGGPGWAAYLKGNSVISKISAGGDDFSLDVQIRSLGQAATEYERLWTDEARFVTKKSTTLKREVKDHMNKKRQLAQSIVAELDTARDLNEKAVRLSDIATMEVRLEEAIAAVEEATSVVAVSQEEYCQATAALEAQSELLREAEAGLAAAQGEAATATKVADAQSVICRNNRWEAHAKVLSVETNAADLILALERDIIQLHNLHFAHTLVDDRLQAEKQVRGELIQQVCDLKTLLLQLDYTLERSNSEG
eukprot:TRINITY_DN21757_c0_g1_i1.p1 TRINITY_DN21757_c0_g1~~TRINITY_DN21757_c0_g1_i1.p1  ORF type:complete len:1098 (-),score=233.40 TRINITY_DN21757_c0_g1_i1:26-3319(-)